MFRSATTRIAHNSTVPGLARISKDLKALQELINAEKAVMQTLQKLAQDLAKSTEALKQWGNGEGDDLGDTLSGRSAVLLHFASALTRFSSHESSVRELMKAVRSREETLDDLKRRRKSLQSNADSADRKLSKMSAENKNFQAQADALNKLRDEIRTMDTDIMTEEASLGDFKRTSAKNWMGVKFGALMECCEKGDIVGELGKLIIAEIPLAPTEPGLPRPYYTGHARTEFLVAEVQRAMGDVTFSAEPNANHVARGIRPLPGQELPPVGGMSRPTSTQMSAMMGMGGMQSSTGSTPEASIRGSGRFSQSILSPPGTFVGLPEVSESTTGGLGLSPYMGPEHIPTQPRSPPPGSIMTSSGVTGSAISLASSNPFASPPPQHQQLALNTSEVNEFGVYPGSGGSFAPRTSSLRNLGDQPTSPVLGGPRGRFATFPVKAAMGPRAQPGSPIAQGQAPPAMDIRAPSLDIDGSAVDGSFSSSVAQALGQDWVAGDRQSTPPTRLSMKALEAQRGEGSADYTSPPPQYTATADIPGLASAQAPLTPSTTTPTVQEEDEDEDDGLAYMIDGQEDPPSASSESHPAGDRRVRFEGTPEIVGNGGNQAAEPASQDSDQQLQQQQEEPETHSATSTNEAEAAPAPESELAAPQTKISTPPPEPQPVFGPAQPPVTLETPPAPPSPVASTEDDEKALNAAAAREVSREMDALMFSAVNRPLAVSSPPPAPPKQPSPVPDAAPLQPPAPPFAHGRISPARPESLRNEPVYVRERERSPSIPPASPPLSDGGRSPSLQHSSVGAHSPVGMGSPTIGEARSPPPPSLSLPPIRGSSPTFSSVTSTTPYRTPQDLPPTPAGPGAFYNLPAMSGSGTLPGSGRTVAAGLFKRQMRSATSPPPLENSPQTAEISPLNVKKRALPASPYPADRSQTDLVTPRVPSAPVPSSNNGSYFPQGQNGQVRSFSGSALGPDSTVGRPTSVVRSSMYHEDDDYDYISAYVDDPPSGPGGDDRRASAAGYGQGRFATNLEHEDIR